jgi:hypothetical protein
VVTVVPPGISHIRFVVAGPDPTTDVTGVIVLGVDEAGGPGGGPDGELDEVPLNSGAGGNIVWANTNSANCPP